MHIPDGFLDSRVCIVTGLLSAGAVSGALRRLQPDSDLRLAPRMGVTAAYVFAAQMVNFPVAAGTSGHLLGALLAAVLLGPHAAAVTMAAVFLIQTFFFLDGGHTALGANVLNMGLAGTYGGYAVYRALAGPQPGRRRCLGAAGAAAWVSVMLGAALTAAQLALSGTIGARAVFPAMLGVHALIGAGEAAITVSALALLWSVRPDVITGRSDTAGTARRGGWALAAGLALVAALAPLASSAPDGLEQVAESLGFHLAAADPRLPGPFPDYSLPGLEETGWAPAAVSGLGALLMAATLGALAAARRRAGRLTVGTGGSGPASPLDARVKLGGMLALIATGVLLPSSGAGKLWILLAAAAAWAAAERVSPRWLGGRALLLLPFVGLAALSSWNPAVTGGPSPSLYGVIFLKAGIALLATAAFVTGTPEPAAIRALAAYRVPEPLAQTVVFALRYLRVLREEAARMLQARSARSVGAGTLALRGASTGSIVGSLFLRSLERSERITQAMEARGFRGVTTRPEREVLRTPDFVFLGGLLLFLTGVSLWP